MAKKRFLVSTKAKGLKFEILRVNKDLNPPMATLQGATGVPFDIPLTEETLTRYGYVPHVVEVADHAAVPA